VTITAKDAANNSVTSDPFSYSVTDYSVTPGTASAILPGGSTTVPIALAAQNGYTGTVNASCSVGTAPVTCSLSPVGPYSVSSSTNLTATITGPGNAITTAGGNYNLTITTADAGFSSLAHNANVAVTVQDYKLQIATTTATVTAGGSTTFTVTPVAQAGGFSGQVTFDTATVCGGLPSKTSCTVNNVANGQVTVSVGVAVPITISTTAATTASIRPVRNPNAPLLAFWTMLPGAMGIVLLGGAPRLPGLGRRGRTTKQAMWILLGLILILLVVMTACGGGGGGTTTTPPPTPVPGTPAGTYTITFNTTASSGATAMTRTAQVTLTVQ
jgi:hypothetical protein